MLIYATFSHVGNVREENEDRLSVWQSENFPYYCLALADGMGGLSLGGLAAEIFLENVYKEFSKLKKSLETPNRENFWQIYQNTLFELNSVQEKQKARLGTTATIAFILPNKKVVYSWLGDSRIYHFNGENLFLLTNDHTVAQKLVDEGMISPSEAKRHPTSHVLTQALVSGHTLQSIEYGEMSLGENELLLLCSDGLTGELLDEEILQILKSYPLKKPSLNEIKILGQKLLDEALDRIGRDNISFILAQYTE